MQNNKARIKIEINNEANAPIKIAEVKKDIKKFLKDLSASRKPLDISVALVDKKTIRELNRRYRRVNKITNVLTFGKLGEDFTEIVICWDRIKEEALGAKMPIGEYFDYALKHGIKNLLKAKSERKI